MKEATLLRKLKRRISGLDFTFEHDVPKLENKDGDGMLQITNPRSNDYIDVKLNLKVDGDKLIDTICSIAYGILEDDLVPDTVEEV